MQNGTPKYFIVGALLLAAGAIAYLSLGGLGENLVYYWNPTELHAAGSKAEGAVIRLGGMVKEGSIQLEEGGTGLRFEVTDGTQTVVVEGKNMPPQMFREGIGVVVEGTVRPDGVFESETLMVKHNNEYQAPEDGENVDVEDLSKSMEGPSS